MAALYVKKLLTQIDASPNDAARAMLIAELACYWARVGEFDEAERLRLELRGAYGDGRDVRVSILIMCIEGLLLYFRELSPGATDRLARARLLSVASGQNGLIALTSAWLAHVHFNGNRYAEMADAIRVCLNAIDSSNLPAVCRLAMLLGDAYLYTGSPATAQIWYERARGAALELGDQAFIGALTYNRSALRVFLARVASASGVRSDEEIGLLSGEVQSAINYQSVARLRSLDHLLETSRAGVLMLQRNFAMAKAAIEALLASDEVRPGTPQAKILRADLALCLAELNEDDASAQALNRALTLDLENTDAGDRVIILASIGDFYKRIGIAKYLHENDVLLSKAILDQRVQTEAIGELLVPFRSVSILS